MLPDRILIATAPSGLQRLQKVLAGCHLASPHTIDEARSMLREGRYGCIVLGIQFDESRTLKLLQHLRTDETQRTISAICSG